MRIIFLFDFKIISAEIIRQNLPLNLSENKIIYDTMHSNIELCKIKNEFGYYKYPTLSELHLKLFENDFEGAHDAKNDVIATAKCFWHLRYNSKIDFDKLPNLKEEIQFREEILMEELSIFYSSRKQFGEFLFDACRSGIIGEILRKEEERIKLNTKSTLNKLNIYSNPKLLINWTLELEKLFLKSPKNKELFFDYVEFKSLSETIEFLKSKDLYFPKNSLKLENEMAMFILSSGFRYDKFQSMKLYDIIGNIISKFEVLENRFIEQQKELLKNNSGCVLIFGFVAIISLIKYFA